MKFKTQYYRELRVLGTYRSYLLINLFLITKQKKNTFIYSYQQYANINTLKIY